MDEKSSLESLRTKPLVEQLALVGGLLFLLYAAFVFVAVSPYSELVFLLAFVFVAIWAAIYALERVRGG